MHRAVAPLAILIVGCGPEVEIEALPTAASASIAETPTQDLVIAHRSTVVDADVVMAGTPERLEDDGEYRKMRLRLWGRRARRALEALPENIDTSLFPDRMALGRGQAHEALNQREAAKEAYLEAIRTGRATAVVREASEGLVRVLGRLGAHEDRLVYLDGLIEEAPEDEPAYELEIERAKSHAALERTDEAKAALRSLIERYPNPQIVELAESTLLSIDKRRRPSREEVHAKEVGRLFWIARTYSKRRALRVVRRARGAIANDPRVLLLKADLLADRGRRWAAQSVLESLRARHEPSRPEVALRIARLARDRYQYPRARLLYQAVVDGHAGTDAAVTAGYEAAAMEWDADEYDAAAERARIFLETHPDSKHVPAAEWLAGFSAYLSGDNASAKQTFETALAREERPRFRYWFGRCLEHEGDEAAAGEAYEQIVRTDPLTYYGHLARKRLTEMGAPEPLEALPFVPAPESVDSAIALLGPARPVNIDRAAALFDGNLRREGTEELLSVAEHFRRTGNTHGATLVLDLFQLFDKDAWVFLLSRWIAEKDDPADLKLRPYYWRVWRYAFPTPFEAEVKKASEDNRVDPFLVYAVMRTESLFRPHAVSPVGARGLMQLMPRTARWIGRRDKRAKPFAKSYRRPASNIWLGSWNLRFLLDRFEGNVVHALAGYNAGPGAVDRWRKRFARLTDDEFVERIPYDETRRYVRRAIESRSVYEKLRDNGGAQLSRR